MILNLSTDTYTNSISGFECRIINSLKDFGLRLGVRPIDAPDSKATAGELVKAKRYSDSVLDGYIYNQDW